MISEHSAHSTPQPFGIRTWLWRYTCVLLLNSMLWHRQAIFESKGDKLSSSSEGRIRTHQGLRHQIASRLNARWLTDWAIEDQAKNLNSTARPYDQQAFSPLDPTTVSPLRQWCGWNSTQHQTWRSTVSGDFMACQLTTLSLFNTYLIRYADKVC